MLIITTWAMSAPVCLAAEWYVAPPPAGNDGKAGTSWAAPFATIQKGVDIAAGATRDVVWVSNGTYSVAPQINVSKDITVRGFGAREQVVVTRNTAYTNRIFYVNAPNAVLDRLTIRNGLLQYGNGCGVYLQQGMLTNCLIVSNNCWRSAATTPWGYGMGVYVSTGSLWNCALAYNGRYYANYTVGGGVYVAYTGTIAFCTIGPTNQAQYGAGINAANRTRITGCTVARNQSWNMAAGIVLGSRSLVESCSVVSNRPNGPGTGASYAGIQVNGADNTVRKCAIIGNLYGGLQIDSAGSGALVENCVVRNNTVVNPAALYVTSGAVVSVRSSVIAGNESYAGAAHCGAGVRARGPGAVIENCTIVANQASVSGSTWVRVGGAWVDYGATLRNCIVVSNKATTAGTGMLRQNLYYAPEGVVEYTCSSTDLVHGANGCITNRPGFSAVPRGYGKSSTAGDLSLVKGSPCINAGANSAWMAGALDMADRTRRDPVSDIVDMGAYEYIPGGTMFWLR
jgi:hypothetical protein